MIGSGFFAVAPSVPSAKPSICAEKRQLGSAFVEAIHNVMELQNQELAARIAGRDGLDRFQLAIALARLRRDQLKKLYLLHVQSHGC